jgi:hypothetical protein
MSNKKRYRKVEPSERRFEVVELLKEKDGDFVLVKIPLEDLHKLAFLKTDEKRREYQREAQRKYRQRVAAKQKKTIV